MNTFLRALTAGMLIAIAGLSVALADEPIVIKFSHVVANDTAKGKGALKFKELAEKYTSGKVKVEVYPNSALYKDKEELDALQLGAVQMLAPAVSKFGPLGIREFDVLELPFMFDDSAALHKVIDGSVGQGLLKRLEPKGIVGLSFWENGFKGISANKPIRTPDDTKGLKMRIPSSKVIDATVRSISGIPQVMALSEVYQALQTGVVDGTENTPSIFYTQKMHEVQKYLTLTDHNVTVYVVIAGKKFWQGLPQEIRAQLETAIKDTTAYVNTIAAQENNDALAGVRKSGRTQILTLSGDEKRAWKKSMLRVHKDYEGKIGKDLIESVYQATGFDPGKL